MDNKLQVKFGTKRTEFRVRLSDITTDPIPATFDNDPSAIRTNKFLELGEYL